MNRTHTCLAIGLALIGLGTSSAVQADVVTGTFTNWVDLRSEGFTFDHRYIGDGTNSVLALWSLAECDDTDEFGHGPLPDAGYFYGSVMTGGSELPPDTEVAIAVDITDVSHITDASIFQFTNATNYATDRVYDAEQRSGIGDFVVFHNTVTGHYGALRVDDIYGIHENPRVCARMDATWWFQTDGSASFVPEPSGISLLVIAVLTVLRRR